MLLILFGKAGAGKSYVGSLFEQFNFQHIDGDACLTDEMKEYVREEKDFTQEMVDIFTRNVIQTLSTLAYRENDFVFSQAFYRQKNRNMIREQITGVQFVMIDAPDDLCLQRVEMRANWVSRGYAQKIAVNFEAPSGDEVYSTLQNATEGEEQVIADIRDLLEALRAQSSPVTSTVADKQHLLLWKQPEDEEVKREPKFDQQDQDQQTDPEVSSSVNKDNSEQSSVVQSRANTS